MAEPLNPVSALAEQDEADLYDERRLSVLVRFSASLRWPMTLIACVIAAIAWVGGCAPITVAVWLLATILVRELRATALLKLIRQHDQPIKARLRKTAWLTLALGLAHGSSALFMLKLDTTFDAVLTMVLMSLSAGAVSTTFTALGSFVAYTGAISVPIAAMWLLGGDGLHVSLGLLVLMFMAVQIRFARQNMQLFEESYRIRLENIALLRQLSEERAQLAHARDAAVQADQSKSRFLAAASHDLRQPLQSLSLNSGALSRRLLDSESRQIADEISVGIEALRQMLDALLDVSKLDAGAVIPRLQPIPLQRLILGLCARFRPTAESKGLRLICDCPDSLVVVSDVELLQRVLSNLLDNAIKFTATGAILLSAHKDGTQVQVSVCDSGIGILAADQSRVFDDLVQLGNPQRDRAAGHGLGLGIVKRLAQLLGISYEIKSEPGSGTDFQLRMAAGNDALPLVTDTPLSFPSLAGRRVLVLDDDGAVRSAYAHALQSLGCTVRCTASLAEALATLPEHAPEIALVDQRLAAEENGLQAVARLRLECPGLAAVIVSADTGAALSAAAMRLGVPLLRKPVSDAMLAIVINEALHRSATPEDRTTIPS